MSDMSSLYHGEIMEWSRGDINAGVVPNGLAAKQTNPWCGDECLISAAFDDDCDGRIVQCLHQTRGCVLTLAAAAKATTMAMQLGDAAQVLQLTDALVKMLKEGGNPPEGLQLFTPVIQTKNRHQCILLPFLALGEVINNRG